MSSTPPRRVEPVDDPLLPGRPWVRRPLPSAAAAATRHEFRALAALGHPALALPGRLSDDDPARPWASREWVDGDSLATAADDATTLFDAVADLLRGLAFLHDLGRLHGAIQPSNVILRRRPRLGFRGAWLDHGPVLRSASSDEARVRDPFRMPYLASEVLEGRGPSVRADLYALGVTIFESLHGAPPFRAVSGDVPGFVDAVRAGRRRRPPVPASLPAALTAWIDDLLATEPEQRPANARDALDRLSAVAGRQLARESEVDRSARLAGGSPPGREGLAAEIWSRLARDDAPRVMWVVGDPGAGGRRLLGAVAAEAAARGRDVIVFDDGAIPPTDVAGDDDRPPLVVIPGVGRRHREVEDAIVDAMVGGGTRVLASISGPLDDLPGPRRLLEASGRLRGVERLDLEPLDAAGALASLDRALGVTDVPKAAWRRLLTHAAGHAATLTAALVDGRWLLRRSAVPSSEGLPNELPAGAGTLLAILAAAHRGVPSSTLGAIAGLDHAEARERVAELRSCGLADLDDGGAVRPRSRHVADRSLAALDPARRALFVERLREIEVGATVQPRRPAIAAAAARGLERAQAALDEGRFDIAHDRARDAARRAWLAGDDACAMRAVILAADAALRAGRSGAATEALALCEGQDAGDTTPADRLAQARDSLAAAGPAAPRSAAGPASPAERLIATIEGRLRTGDVPAGVVEELTRALAGGRLTVDATLRGRLALAGVSATTDPAHAADLATELTDRAEALDRLDHAAAAAAIATEARRRAGDPERAAEMLQRGRRLLDRAAGRIRRESWRRAFVGRRAFAGLRGPSGLATGAIDRRLVALYDIISTVNSERDPEALLRAILDRALDVVHAERGSILLREEDGTFRVRTARNLEQETIADAETFSSGVVARAAGGEAVLTLDAREDARFRALQSVSLYDIRSVMCVPLRCRDTIVGAVYLDTRSGAAAFTRDDLRFLEAFADHAGVALQNARRAANLADENRRLQAAAEARARYGNLVGRSPAMIGVFELIDRVAASELPVMIAGESGTGKELVARAIHFNGPRAKQAFVTENCAALPDALLQSELFGHVRGAFTGADRDRAGLFQQAHGGSLLLDEVGDMSPTMQALLLRAIQHGEVRPVGGDRVVTVDVRVIAATHRDLQADVQAGRFRQDLYFRLQVLPIVLPPLRSRTGDVALLAVWFLERIARSRGRPRPEIAPEVVRLLEAHRWPGNVRQLESTLQRVSLLAGDGPITTATLTLDPELERMLRGDPERGTSALSLATSEREQIGSALRAAGGNRARAARMLGISRATIYRKIREYRL